MKYRNLAIILLLFCLCVRPVLTIADEALPVMEMSADRVTIYPQRMELNGEETLFDILQLYPDILTNAYDNWLENYEIRIDNGPYGGDMRVLLNEMKAVRIKKIQISDNPGVAKGTTGMEGVVDVFLMPIEKGAHGTVAAEISQNVSTTPFVEFRYGSNNTDILANASYNFVPIDPYDTHKQYSNFHMINQLGEKDQLVTYFTQSYERTHFIALDPVYIVDIDRKEYRTYFGQLRHYHYFKPDMSLMSAVVYQYGRYPVLRPDYPSGVVRDSISNERTHIVAVVEEFNATLFDGFNLMAGVEADFVIDDKRNKSSYYNGFNSDRFNADMYAELDYTFRNWRFTVGDRVRYFRYHVVQPSYPSDVDHLQNRCHNLLHTSVIYTPHREHQIQLAYVQKYISPSYTAIQFDAEPIHEVKLAYNFARPNVSASLGTYHYNYNSYGNNAQFFKIDASAYYHYRFFSISGGVSSQIGRNGDDYKYAFASFRLTPTFEIPYGMQVKVRTEFYTPTSWHRGFSCPTLPYKSSMLSKLAPYESRPVYADLQFSKYWKHVDVYALWHDIFNGNYGIATLGVRVKM